MLTRDSKLWTVLFTVGLAMAGALLVANPVDYGMSPVQFKWLQLLATGFVAVGGKLGTSPQPHSEFGNAKITPEDKQP